MNSLDDIKADVRRGRLNINDIDWLITQVEQQRNVIQELKNKTRFKKFLEIAQENLALEEGIKRTREQRDFYKQAYESLKK